MKEQQLDLFANGGGVRHLESHRSLQLNGLNNAREGMKMTIEVYELERWGWDCPECGHFNEISEDPSYEEELYCFECEKTFSEFEVK